MCKERYRWLAKWSHARPAQTRTLSRLSAFWFLHRTRLTESTLGSATSQFAMAEPTWGWTMRRYAKPVLDLPPGRMGRPPRLRPADEWELYCYRKSGAAIKTCAAMFRVSVPTANRIIAKFREYDARVEPLAREFREKLAALRVDAAEPANVQEVTHG